MEKTLFIDIETKSSVDISKSGAYKYAEAPDFAILLFAYKYSNSPVSVIDLAEGETVPQDVVNALSDPTITKHAWNAAFEWYCLNQAGFSTPIEQWECSMVRAMYHGYPAALDKAGEALGIAEDKKKLTAGKALIRYFCQPCKPTKSNGGRTWNLPKHDTDKWKLFKEYNAQDVEAEYAIERMLDFNLPEHEWERWRKDTLMMASGVKMDSTLIEKALYISDRATGELLERAKEITHLENPKSNSQLLSWVRGRGVDTDSLAKDRVGELLGSDIPDDVREMLSLKQQLSKSSNAKYEAMAHCQCMDHTAKGLIQYYASRTGRYGGRLVQVQNLPRNYIKTLDDARQLVLKGDYEGLKLLYGNVPDVLSQLIRTVFIPKHDKFIVCDFSSIEARIAAWLAGEEWVLDVFRNGGDIYCETASQMFGVPVEKHGINSELRQKGKIAVLALGYQGGTGALKAMGALNMGIAEEELQPIVDSWRQANSKIRDLWNVLQFAAEEVIQTGFIRNIRGIELRLEMGESEIPYLTVLLPSGRKLLYCRPQVEREDWKAHIYYMGVNQTTRKWERQETYGGKLFENIVQAIARDCLVVAMDRLERMGYEPVMHIHDEIVLDAYEHQSLSEVAGVFAESIDWADGLPLSGDGFEGEYYRKD